MVVKYNDKFMANIEKMSNTIYIVFTHDVDDSCVNAKAEFKAEAGIGVACYPDTPDVVMTSESISDHVRNMIRTLFKEDKNSLKKEFFNIKCWSQALLSNVIESTR